MSGFTPVNQVRLTNVATVRLAKKGKRFEIACYRNKIISYRNKLETNLKEVLQIDTVFTNVSKGNLANSKDLMDAFGTSDQLLVCKEILEKGEMQVSEQERVALYESVFRDIANIVADKTVNPENNIPYTTTMIQNAMKQIQYSVNVSKSSKSQALEVIRKLRELMPIARANMLLRITTKSLELSAVLVEIERLGGIVVAHSSLLDGSEQSADIKVDPEHFRTIEDIVKKTTELGRVEVLQMRVAGPATVSATSVSSVAAQAIQPMIGIAGTADAKEFPIEKVEQATESITSVAKDSKKASGQSSSGYVSNRKKGENLQELLNEMGIHEDSDESESDAVTNESIQGKKSKKNKPKKTRAVRDSEETDSTSATAETIATYSEKSSLATVDQPVKMKVSKKEKRAEKEEKKEREAQAKILQDRINQERLAKFKQQESDGHTAINVDQIGATAATAVTSRCNTCGGLFCDIKQYREHFKSEWHRFNLKRKLKNLPIIGSEDEFLLLTVDQLEI